MKLLAPSHNCEYDPDHYDCTGHIGQMNLALGDDQPFWPMYSFDRPSYILWNAIAKNLHKRGWPDEKIKTWLQSKEPRWALDGDLQGWIIEIADRYATEQIKD